MNTSYIDMYLLHYVSDVGKELTPEVKAWAERSEEQKEEQPARENTGLFLFRGKPGAPFAVISPGGGFSYVGSIHEGFPYAAEISCSICPI